MQPRGTAARWVQLSMTTVGALSSWTLVWGCIWWPSDSPFTGMESIILFLELPGYRHAPLNCLFVFIKKLEIVSHYSYYVARDRLEPAMQTRLALNLQRPVCLYLPTTGIKVVHHYLQLVSLASCHLSCLPGP